MAGRRPTPTTLKLMTGNPGKRGLNRKEPAPRREIPPCPTHLDDTGKAAWSCLSVLLDGMGVLTVADALALERLCDCYADILACRALIAGAGRTYTTVTQQGYTLIKGNPAVGQLHAADVRLKSYLTEFGLTPAARSKVQAVPDDDEKENPLDEFFGP